MAITTCLSDLCTSERKNSGQGCIDPTVTFTGAVLEKYEVNGSDDSDFCAIVFDQETGKLRTVEYASTRGWTYHNGAQIDATDNVIAAARTAAQALWVMRFTYQAERQASDVLVKDREVRSLTTRGKNVGVTGIVKWHGEDAYRSSRWAKAYRVGLKVEGEVKLRYLPADRVEVINPEPVDANDVLQLAWLAARERSFQSAMDARGLF
jgi:hypothetical protein